jgi:hypothetical protein
VVIEKMQQRNIAKQVDRNGELCIPFFEITDSALLGVIANGVRSGQVVTLKGRKPVSPSVSEFFESLAKDPECYSSAVYGHEPDPLSINVLRKSRPEAVEAWLKKCAE